MMLSQLNLRFHKKLIDALKVRAGRENTSVNALAERFLDDGLKTTAAGDGYFQLVADPDATVRQLYRKIVAGVSWEPVSRDELRFMLVSARQGYLRGRHRLVTRPTLSTLLQIVRELLTWQVEQDRVRDEHYLRGTYRLSDGDLLAGYDQFLAGLCPVIDHATAEQLLRPLESGCLELADFPNSVLTGSFTQARLREIFPLVLYGLERTESQVEAFVQEMRPLIPAVTQTIEADTLRLDIQIDGLPAGQRPGALYRTPKLHMILTGKEFVYPCGWAPFSELLGLLTLYARRPEALQHGHQGGRVMFSPPGSVMPEGFFGIDGLRIFLPAEAFETLVRELTTHCDEGMLAEALTGLRSLYGDT
ncbi:transcriptional regulator (plasmid) [Serratia marcescens]|nr:transcriptional regulator [Serratia marcescens]